jgi:quercetin dioxygenase-like cupin family protein
MHALQIRAFGESGGSLSIWCCRIPVTKSKEKKTMSANRILFRLMVAAALLAVGMVMLTAPTVAQGKKRHKFFLGDSPKQEDSEVITQFIIGDADSEGLFNLMNDVWKVGFSTQTHFHKTHYEIFYLKSGEAEWTVDGETHKMKAGDAVYIPANAPHSARTLGNKPADFLMFYFPGSYEAHREREAEYTEKQRDDPKIQEMLRRLNDFNLVVKK